MPSKVVIIASILTVTAIVILALVYFMTRDTSAETQPSVITPQTPVIQQVTTPETPAAPVTTTPAPVTPQETTPVPPAAPATTDTTPAVPANAPVDGNAAVCNGILENEANYYFGLYPDVAAAAAALKTPAERSAWAKSHWNNNGFREGRKSCWPIPTATGYASLETKNGVCNGVLENEANYYFNLYPDIWKYAVSNYKTKAERNTFAKTHATGTGAAEGRLSCWSVPKPPAGACNGVLESEANYYFNLYDDVWQYANKTFKTKAEMNDFAKIHAVGTGKTEGRKSCWT